MALARQHDGEAGGEEVIDHKAAYVTSLNGALAGAVTERLLLAHTPTCSPNVGGSVGVM